MRSLRALGLPHDGESAHDWAYTGFQESSRRSRPNYPGRWPDVRPDGAIQGAMIMSVATIHEQCGGRVGAFVCGVGTGGTITGVGRFLKAHCPDVLVVLADPIGSRLAHLVDQTHPDYDAAYQLEGIGGSVMPSVCDPGVIDLAER
jgi:Pyridoxal-phosphate dependent enzyme